MTPDRGAANLVAIVEREATETGERVFLVDPDFNRTTVANFEIRARQAAAFLQSLGVGRGDRVCTICNNCTEYFVATFGAWRIGAIAVPLNPDQRGAILAQMIGDAEPAVILHDDDGQRALDSLPEGVARPPAASLDRLGDADPAETPPASYDPVSPALILYSSGTTGVSKGCVLSHEYMVWAGEEFCRAGSLTPADSVYTSGPFYHINAWWAFAGSVVGGLTHTFEVRFSASRFWDRAAAAGATIFDYVGVMVAIMLRREEGPGPACRLRAGLGGAARPDEVEAFRARFGVALLECYGLTECCLPIFQREHEFRTGSIGLLSEFFEARLVDDHGADVPEGGMGELWLKPKERRVIFSGYWRRPDLTEAAFRDGWFRTGDMCRRDAEGYYYYLDRKRHFIRRRGENISPFEVEGVIFDHPAVANCAIIGVPAELGEEDVLLAVQPKEGMAIDPAALVDWCRERLADHLVPRYVRVMRLPLTPSERVEKQKLRDAGVTPDTYDAGTGRSANVSNRKGTA